LYLVYGLFLAKSLSKPNSDTDSEFCVYVAAEAAEFLKVSSNKDRPDIAEIQRIDNFTTKQSNGKFITVLRGRLSLLCVVCLPDILATSSLVYLARDWGPMAILLQLAVSLVISTFQIPYALLK
jgi:hypothetical protein